MKILKALAIATIATTTLLVASCKKQDPKDQEIVKYEKKHDTAVLLVTFGSTFDDPHATYKKQIADFQQASPMPMYSSRLPLVLVSTVGKLLRRNSSLLLTSGSNLSFRKNIRQC